MKVVSDGDIFYEEKSVVVECDRVTQRATLDRVMREDL